MINKNRIRKSIKRKVLSLFLFMFIALNVVYAQKPELKILKTSPQGQLKILKNPEIIIVFSDDMKILGKKREIGKFIEIKPSIEGSFKWRGNSTIIFRPYKRFGYSTEYTVKIKKGLNSVNGKILKKNYFFKFQTPTPLPSALKQTDYWENLYFEDYKYSKNKIEIDFDYTIKTDKPIYIKFNQSIEEKGNLKKIEVYDKNTFTLLKSDKSFEKHNIVKISFKKPLEKERGYFIKIKKGIKSEEGNLLSSKNIFIYFKTEEKFKYKGEKEIFIFKDKPILRLRFNKRITKNYRCIKDNKIDIFRVLDNEKIRITDFKIRCSYSRMRIELKSPETNGNYLIKIPSDFQDEDGEKLNNDLWIKVKICGYIPDIKLGKFENGKLLIKTKGIKRAEFKILKIKDPVKFSEKINKILEPNIKDAKTMDFKIKTQEGYGNITIDLKKLFNTDKGIFIIKTNNIIPQIECKKTKDVIKYIKQYWGYILNSPEIYSSALSLNKGTLIVSGNRTDLNKAPYTDFYFFKKGKLYIKTKTDKNGINFVNKRIPANRWYYGRENNTILLKKGEDISFSYTRKDYVSRRGNFYKNNIVYDIFSDRGYYLPGDTIHIGGIITKLTENNIIPFKSGKIKLIIKNPEYKIIKKAVLNLDRFGGFFYDFKTDKKSLKGRYTFTVKKGDWKSSPLSVRVDFFKPNIIEISAKVQKPEIVSDEVNNIHIKGSYLSGAPMANDKVLLKTKINSSIEFFINKLKKEYREYNFTPLYVYKHLKQKKKLLDKNGETDFSITLKEINIHSLSQVIIETIGISKDGKEYSVRNYFNYIPSDAIVGIKTPYFIKSGKEFTARFLALNSKGKETTANADIIIEREYWEKRKNKTETVFKSSFTIDKRKDLKLKFKKPGYYKITVYSKDKRGFKSITKSGFYLWNYDYNLSRTKREGINLKFDKKSYNIGDIAKVYISSPEKGKGFIILFTENIEKKYFIDFNKTTEFSFKIRENYFPSIGFFVAVHYKDKKGDRKVRATYSTIRVMNPKKMIYIDLSVPKEFSPSKEYSIKIKTKNYYKKGIKSKLFVFAVDEGVLSLSGYKTPNPFSIIYSPQDFPFTFYDSFSKPDFYKLYLILTKRLFKKGAPGREGVKASMLTEKLEVGAAPLSAPAPENSDKLTKNIRLRNLFKTTLFFNKIETDKFGNAVVKFKTSDLLSTYRLIAVAYNKDMFGSKDKRFKVSKKLLMKESYPDFLRIGDTVKAGVILTNRTDKKMNVKIILKTDGKIKVEDKTIKEIEIAPQNSKTIYFNTKAIKIGETGIKFYAISGKLKDGIEKKVEVKENIVKRNFIDFSAGENIMKTYELLKIKKPKLKLIFSSSIIDSSFSIAKKLIIYPYECLEQRTSKLFPFLFIDSELIKYGDFKYNQRQVKKRIKKYLKKLPSFKNDDGGLGYYENTKSSPYLTAYVLYALKLIKNKGYKIDEKLKNELLKYIDWHGKDNSFTLFVKALYGMDVSEEIKKQYSNFENLSVLNKAFLIKALNLSKLKNKESMIDTIIKDIEKYIFVEADFAYFKKPEKYDYFEYPFYSNRYLTAVVLGAILDTGKNYILADRMIKYLTEKEKNPWWWFSTHTNVWTIYAINKYVENIEKGFKKSVDINIYENSKLKLKKIMNFVHPKQKYIKILKAEKEDKNIKLKAEGKSMFYLTSELNQAADISKSEDNGINIERIIYNEKGERVAKLQKGKIYQVILKIKTIEPMDYVVIDEPLIGGVIVLREDIKTTRELFDFRTNKNNRYYYWWWGVKRKSYQKDRIVFYTYRINKKFEISYHIKALYSGKYTLLPTSAFSMYHPQFNGRERKLLLRVN